MGSVSRKRKRQKGADANASRAHSGKIKQKHLQVATVRDLPKDASFTQNFSLLTHSNPNPKFAGPFSDRQSILLVGEGNFSFSLSLAVQLGGKQICATSLDSKREISEKYKDGLANVMALTQAGARCHHGVDCTELEKFQVGQGFDKVVFNFPHVGGATEEDVKRNQKILLKFFQSSQSVLDQAKGEILVSLRSTPFYDSWKVEDLAQMANLRLKSKEKFEPGLFPGYTPVRTNPAFRESPSVEDAYTYTFAKLPGNRAASISKHPVSSMKRASNSCSVDQPVARTKKLQQTSFVCSTCTVTLATLKKWNQHINSPKHARKVKAQKKLRTKAE